MDDSYVQALDLTMQAAVAAFERLEEVLRAMLDAIMEAFKRFTRFLLSVRLSGAGLPVPLANWLAWHLSWRWVPVKWAWALVRHG